MADEPLPTLGGKTPLEYAQTPNMDRLAHDGAMGQIYAVGPGVKVDSDAAHLAMLGQPVDIASSNRGAYEALGAGFTLGPHDLGFRVNFATIDGEFTLLDGRAGRIKGEAKQLEEAVNEHVKLSDAAFEFKQTLGFKGALVLKKGDSTVDLRLPTQYGVGTKVWVHPLIQTPQAIHTAEALNEFMVKSHDTLKSHPVNVKRLEHGDPPANVVMPWAVGRIARLNPTMDRYGRSLCVAAVPVIKGVCKYSGMDIVDVPRTTGEYDTDTLAKASAALERLDAYDVILVHVEGTDEASHDGNVEGKLIIIEKIDAMIGRLLEHTDADTTRFALLSDHGSSCRTHDHMKSSVPIAVCGAGVQADGVKRYDEPSAARGRLDTLLGKGLMPLLTRAQI